ncbi:MAG: tetratricopeptide repeat protein [Phycisphaerales bacterium]|nr:tetratricopeptide repeat protein [Phycisphaerales bacterium]
MPSIEALQRLLLADPDDAFVLYGLAHEHAKAGNHTEALAWYDRCLAIDPNYCYAYYHKARTLEALSRIPDAIATLKLGTQAANRTNDGHALSELQAFLTELT